MEKRTKHKPDSIVQPNPNVELSDEQKRAIDNKIRGSVEAFMADVARNFQHKTHPFGQDMEWPVIEQVSEPDDPTVNGQLIIDQSKLGINWSLSRNGKLCIEFPYVPVSGDLELLGS